MPVINWIYYPFSRVVGFSPSALLLPNKLLSRKEEKCEDARKIALTLRMFPLFWTRLVKNVFALCLYIFFNDFLTELNLNDVKCIFGNCINCNKLVNCVLDVSFS